MMVLFGKEFPLLTKKNNEIFDVNGKWVSWSHGDTMHMVVALLDVGVEETFVIFIGRRKTLRYLSASIEITS